VDALRNGDSLVIFPEGTRSNKGEPQPFKSGLYHLAEQFPEVQLIPAWIDNVQRVMPKGEVVPVPILCTVTFGAPMQLQPGEDKRAFLERARAAVLACGRLKWRRSWLRHEPGSAARSRVNRTSRSRCCSSSCSACCCWCRVALRCDRCATTTAAQREQQLRRDLRAVWLGAWCSGWPGCRARWAPRWPSASSRSWRCASSSRWCTPGAATTAA
jgi:hypothetical protein